MSLIRDISVRITIVYESFRKLRVNCLRFANPAEADWRLEARMLGSEKVRRHAQPAASRPYVF